MEQKILKAGDKVEFFGKTYQAEPGYQNVGCRGCAFETTASCPIVENCSSNHVILKEVKEEPPRHIELGVVKVENGMVTFKIVAQTHRNDEFSQQADYILFEAANGLKLRSWGGPEWKDGNPILHCRGHIYGHDNRELNCTTADFAKISEAVTEYNATDGKGYEKPWPQWDDRYFFVSERGKVDSTCFEEREFDYNLKAIGNFFRTSEEAEAAAGKFKALLKELAAK